MDTLAIAMFRKRREERLAARGIKIKKEQHRKQKGLRGPDKSKTAQVFHKDADSNDNQQNEQRKRNGGHGNTKLPFGLCKKYGIEIDPSWAPRDAWDALEGLGVSPKEEYRKLKEKGKKGTAVSKLTMGGKTYSDLKATSISGSFWGVRHVLYGKDEKGKAVTIKEFPSRESMIYFLKDNGITEASRNGSEKFDPTAEELPERVGTVDGVSYSEIKIGKRGSEIVVTGKEIGGTGSTIHKCKTIEEMRKFMEDNGLKDSDVKIAPSLKKGDTSPSWLTSKKKQYFEEGGVKYGNVTLESYGDTWTLEAEDANGKKIRKRFTNKTDAMMFLQKQGCERLKTKSGVVNPAKMEFEKPVATIGTSNVKDISVRLGSESLFVEGTDMEGKTRVIKSYRLSDIIGGETESDAARSTVEKVAKELGVKSDLIKAGDVFQEGIVKVWKDKKDRERQAAEHERRMRDDPEYRKKYEEERRRWAEEEERMKKVFERYGTGG